MLQWLVEGVTIILILTLCSVPVFDYTVCEIP